MPGKKYKFRVKAVNKEGESEPLECENAVEAKNPYREPDPPKDLEIIDWDNKSVTLRFKFCYIIILLHMIKTKISDLLDIYSGMYSFLNIIHREAEWFIS